jgi:hypothetical protein
MGSALADAPARVAGKYERLCWERHARDLALAALPGGHPKGLYFDAGRRRARGHLHRALLPPLRGRVGRRVDRARGVAARHLSRGLRVDARRRDASLPHRLHRDPAQEREEREGLGDRHLPHRRRRRRWRAGLLRRDEEGSGEDHAHRRLPDDQGEPRPQALPARDAQQHLMRAARLEVRTARRRQRHARRTEHARPHRGRDARAQGSPRARRDRHVDGRAPPTARVDHHHRRRLRPGVDRLGAPRSRREGARPGLRGRFVLRVHRRGRRRRRLA